MPHVRTLQPLVLVCRIIPAWMPGLALALAVSTAGAAGVEVVARDGTLKVTVDGRPAFSYATRPRLEGGHAPEFTRGGFLHPVYSPHGVLVTDAFSHQHPHQTGIFTAWTATQYRGREVDFWNLGKKIGRVEPVSVERIWSGAEQGGFVAHHRYVALDGGDAEPVLDEWWHVTVHGGAAGGPLVFDVEIRQSCAGEHPLALLEYRYGGFAMRGHGQWLATGRVDLLTSEGVTDREAANTTRVRWCAMGGEVDGAHAGVAILSHPTNFRAPQPIRVHPTMPMLCFAPVQLGPHEIRPGEPWVERYRMVVFDGAPDRALLEASWQAFAHPDAGPVAGNH